MLSSIPMSLEMRPKDYLLVSLDVFQANWLAGIIATAAQCVPVLGGVVLVNWLACFKTARSEGRPIDLTALFDFDDAIDKLTGHTGVLGGLFLCSILPTLLGSLGAAMATFGGLFCGFAAYMVVVAAAIQADRRAGFTPSFRAALAFTQASPGPVLKLGLVCGLVGVLGILGLGVGLLATVVIAEGAVFVAYEEHRAHIEVAAAEAGIGL